MVYVEMLGRMGNQMFSYAHARYIQQLFPGEKIAVDFKNFDPQDDTWINYLQYFKCGGNIVAEQRKLNLIQRFVLFLYFKMHGRWKDRNDIYENEKKCAGILSLFNLYIFSNGYYKFKYRKVFKNSLLLGFFESPEFFWPVKEELKKEFSLKDLESNEIIKEFLNDFEPEKAICVGIRKGDFTTSSNKDFCDICCPDYYVSGVNLIKQKIAEKDGEKIDKIYVFTDDLYWARENVRFSEKVEYVTSSIEGKIKPWEMLQAMRYFKYYVIPNSSFFWWGQFLSEYDSPLVVAPNRWRGSYADLFKDIYQDNWILIEAGKGREI